ncbi:hypothetical protein CHLRE_17g745647v5 [Chlamydomonas reinhardtii]|uniref:DnaJ homologue subfamily C member 28 conserved domain-containing protein n=1 Tax=Chlamydomonas reinhardtii TaxID=3055 RepID=A0A2K3CS21_CHLRE|nr:uncharacterized protein CHLRE_17g745647v5 [Chlamydomonas reinhardtii]PNW71077.1 hypothetical protein CHLRE_17g745647v5 [Chlamydomonas reinhardtii]
MSVALKLRGGALGLLLGQWRALNSSAHGGQTVMDEIRVARAGKASSDYRRRRDPDSPAAGASNTQPPTTAANEATGTDAATLSTLAVQSYPSSPAQDPDLLMHPSRARADLNAYARGPKAAAAQRPPAPSAPVAGTIAADAQAASHSGAGHGHPPPPLTWQDAELEDLSGWQPVTYGESGIEAMVERRIRDSVARGELDNLKGRGQPLEALPAKHDAQFYRIDPLLAALSRSMGAQAIKPRSLELRDELAEARREFEQAVAAEARRRRQQRARLGRPAAGPSRAGPGSVAAPVAGGDGNTHGSTSSSSGNGSGDTRREEARCIGEELAAADLPGLAYRFEQVAQLRAQYNGVVLADKEVYGAGWPLEQLRRLEYGQEVAAAAEAALVEQDAHAQERGV